MDELIKKHMPDINDGSYTRSDFFLIYTFENFKFQDTKKKNNAKTVYYFLFLRFYVQT